jgi:hypothetical protein
MHPAGYVEFLRSCIDLRSCSLRTVTSRESACDGSTKRFATLLDVLGSNLPSIELSVAEQIALLDDEYRRSSQSDEWTGNVAVSFALSSSTPKKGRILSAIVRLARCDQCLELGTGYGIFGLFILSALKDSENTRRLLTVEGWEPQFSLASTMLEERYGNMVSCRFAKVRDTLRELANQGARIDFAFHDSGTREMITSKISKPCIPSCRLGRCFVRRYPPAV